MVARRTIGAVAIALCGFFPALAAAQDLATAQDPAAFVPPPCVPGQEMFTDVPASNPFCPWIEQIFRDHITGGCGPQLFCPAAPLTRAQMSVFLELAMRGTDTWIVDADLLDGMNSTDFVTGVGAGTGLTGGGSGGSVTLGLATTYQLPQTCAGGQHPEWTGSGWTCGSPGTGTVTSVGSGAGLTGGPITTSGALSVAPGGITSAMIADGTVGSADVADGSIAAADVASAQVQLRVASPCPAGQFMRAVNADGTPVCAADADSGGTVTSVGSGAGLTGGPITNAGSISVATGGITSAMIADGSIVAADVAAAQVQLRVAAACATGQSIRVVNADGTVVCETDDDAGGTVTSVASGAGLTGGPITGSGTISVAVGGITGVLIGDGTVSGADIADGTLTGADIGDGSIGAADVAAAQVQLRVAAPCAVGAFIRAVNADGTVVCAPDGDSGGTVTSVATGAGLAGGPITGSGTVSVAPGGITSAMIADGTVGAADVASTQVQLRVSQGCGLTGFMRAVFPDGTVSCGDIGTHNHFGQTWSGSATNGLAIFNSGGTGISVIGDTGFGVRSVVEATTGATYGVMGFAPSTSGTGVYGSASAATGATRGVYGSANSPDGTGVEGRVSSPSGLTTGVYGKAESVSGTGVRGESTFLVGGTDPSYGVVGLNHRDLGAGVRGEGPAAGVEGVATNAFGLIYGVVGTTASGSGRGVQGYNTASTGTAYGVSGTTQSVNGAGVAGFASSSTGQNYGVYGQSISTTGYGGYFSGRAHVTAHLSVTGNLTVGGVKNFKIDHPLDPANKYLVHAAIESDEMLNMYSGTAVLDADGTAIVRLPEWFEALNRDFRYQLTCVGGYAPVYIASEVADGRFAIAGGRSGLKVSWQVVGTRSDAHALAHPMAVEEEKPAEERGTYLDPEAHGQPAARGRDHTLTSATRRE